MPTAQTSYFRDDGHPDSYAPDLYRHDDTAQVLPGPESVDEHAVDFYKQQGYIAIANVFSPRLVSDATDALSDLIAGRNATFNGIQLESAGQPPASHDPAAIEAIVRKLMLFTQYDRRLRAMVDHAPLLEIVQKLAGEPVRLFQEMALLKPPAGREKPWHQDHAYFDIEPGKRLVGAWIALDRATIANGCMHLIPGRHHEPVIHFKRRDWQICDSTTMQIKDRCLAVPLEPGGVLFFDSMLPHGTPTNHSADRRRALQFHYAPISAQAIPQADRLSVFGAEGKNVTC